MRGVENVEEAHIDMILYAVIYLLTVIGLTSGGSSTVL
jgi:hypothetical protein